MSYETHVTLFPSDANKVSLEICPGGGWTLSKIDGDPLLGAGVNAYLTSHSKTPELAFERMRKLQAQLNDLGISPRRMKIELIIYDTKTATGLGQEERNVGWEYS